jgi:hypothetical protein
MQYPHIPFPFQEPTPQLYPNPTPSFHHPLKHVHRHHPNPPYYAAHHSPYAHPYLVKHNNQSPQPQLQQAYPHLPVEPAPTESPVMFGNETFERSYQVSVS